MSELPKPSGRKQTKSVFVGSDVTTREHEQLLMRCWDNIDSILERVFTMRDKDVQEQMETLLQRERNGLSSTIKAFDAAIASGQFTTLARHYRVHGETSDGSQTVVLNRDDLRHLKAIRARLQEHLQEMKLALDDDILKPKIITKSFQHALLDDKERKVGFVDIAMSLEVPKNLKSTKGYDQNAFTGRHDFWFEDESDNLRIWTEEDASRSPQVYAEHQMFHLVMDVRTELPTVAQLVREFKMLQDYVPSRECFLVAESIPKPSIDLLSNEGIHAIALNEWLK